VGRPPGGEKQSGHARGGLEGGVSEGGGDIITGGPGRMKAKIKSFRRSKRESASDLGKQKEM